MLLRLWQLCFFVSLSGFLGNYDSLFVSMNTKIFTIRGDEILQQVYLEVNLFSYFKIHGHESDNNFAHPYIQRGIKNTNVGMMLIQVLILLCRKLLEGNYLSTNLIRYSTRLKQVLVKKFIDVMY